MAEYTWFLIHGQVSDWWEAGGESFVCDWVTKRGLHKFCNVEILTLDGFVLFMTANASLDLVQSRTQKK